MLADSDSHIPVQILARAREVGLETLSLRIGQVSGSRKTGAWNVTDWVPIIIKSSIALGSLPELPGVSVSAVYPSARISLCILKTVSWVPVDVVGRTIADIIVSCNALPSTVNVVHPIPVPWRGVFTAVNDALGGHLDMIPFDDWLVKLGARSAHISGHDLDIIVSATMKDEGVYR